MLSKLIELVFRKFRLKKSQNFCPICDADPVVFNPLSEYFLKNAREHGFPYIGQGEMVALDTYECPNCGASDRERLYAYWISTQLENGSLSASTRILHFAPEPALYAKLKRMGFPSYKTADLLMAEVDYNVDIMSTPFEDESFDFFICSHVLEHVESDDQAIRELYRITSKGGCGILVAPIAIGLEKTLEDPNVTDAAGRWRLFGQDDHVRLYAHNDYVDKISSHGFRVEQLGINHFGKDAFQQLGMDPSSILYVVRK